MLIFFWVLPWYCENLFQNFGCTNFYWACTFCYIFCTIDILEESRRWIWLKWNKSIRKRSRSEWRNWVELETELQQKLNIFLIEYIVSSKRHVLSPPLSLSLPFTVLLHTNSSFSISVFPFPHSNQTVWDGSTIVVMKDVRISPPYKTENCTGSSADALERIQKLVRPQWLMAAELSA